MTTRQMLIEVRSGRRIGQALLLSAFVLMAATAVADGGGHGGHSGHGGHGGLGGHGATGHPSGHSGHGFSAAAHVDAHFGSHARAVHGGISHGFTSRPHPGATAHGLPLNLSGGLDDHRFGHHMDGRHFHGHSLWGWGLSYYSGPSYYRYRFNCDPYSFYYDPRYCYGASLYLAPSYSAAARYTYPGGAYVASRADADRITAEALDQAQGLSTDSNPTAYSSSTESVADDSIVVDRLPQDHEARIPLVASPDAPDVLP